MNKARLYCPRCSKIAADKYERICKEHRKGNSYDYGAASREFKLWRNQEYEAALKKYPERALALAEAEAATKVPTYATKEEALEVLNTPKAKYCARYHVKALHLPCDPVTKELGYLPCDNCPVEAQGTLFAPTPMAASEQRAQDAANLKNKLLAQHETLESLPDYY